MNSSDDDKQAVEQRERPPVALRPASEALRSQRGGPPLRRSRQSRNRFVVFLNFLLSVIVLAVVALGVGAYYGKVEFDGKGPATTASTIVVKPNMGVRQIADELEDRGLISDARIFTLGVRAYGNNGKLKAGEYAIKPGASMHDIMDIMRSGKSVMYSLTIPEGFTVQQAFDRIATDDVLVGDMPSEMPPEGSLAADTQRFTRGATRQEVIAKMEAEQKALVQSIWEKRAPDLPLKSVDDLVTLASIVEKETGKPGERPHVAAVFLNRLRKGMRLQSDPTIIYGIFGGKGKPPDRLITRADIEKRTPYNTYVIPGLPPTPIDNPGRAALEAAANPSDTSDLYFVADGTGGHVFSATLDEHNQNVARWRRLQKKERAAESLAPGADDTHGEPGARE